MRIAAFLAVILLAGCTDSTGEWHDIQPPPPPPEDPCERGICLADPQSHDAQLMLNLTGFRQITSDDRAEQTFGIDGDLVAWDVDQPRGGPRIKSDVYATSLGSGRLYELSVDESLHAILPKVSQGHVVWSQYGEHSGIIVWNASRDESWKLDTGLNGSLKAVGFDYPWVVYYEQSGYETWAQNLESGEQVLVYNHSMLEHREHYNLYRGADVGNGVVVYAVSYANEASDHFNGTFYILDLETKGRQSIEWLGHGINNFRTNGEHTIIESGHVTHLLEHSTQDFNRISHDGSELCGSVSIGGDWAAYSCQWEGLVVHIPTLDEIHLGPGPSFIPPDGGGGDLPEYVWTSVQTDGEIIVAKSARMSAYRFDNVWRDIYWMDVPSMVK